MAEGKPKGFMCQCYCVKTKYRLHPDGKVTAIRTKLHAEPRAVLMSSEGFEKEGDMHKRLKQFARENSRMVKTKEDASGSTLIEWRPGTVLMVPVDNEWTKYLDKIHEEEEEDRAKSIFKLPKQIDLGIGTIDFSSVLGILEPKVNKRLTSPEVVVVGESNQGRANQSKKEMAAKWNADCIDFCKKPQSNSLLSHAFQYGELTRDGTIAVRDLPHKLNEGRYAKLFALYSKKYTKKWYLNKQKKKRQCPMFHNDDDLYENDQTTWEREFRKLAQERIGVKKQELEETEARKEQEQYEDAEKVQVTKPKYYHADQRASVAAGLEENMDQMIRTYLSHRHREVMSDWPQGSMTLIAERITPLFSFKAVLGPSSDGSNLKVSELFSGNALRNNPHYAAEFINVYLTAYEERDLRQTLLSTIPGWVAHDVNEALKEVLDLPPLVLLKKEPVEGEGGSDEDVDELDEEAVIADLNKSAAVDPIYDFLQTKSEGVALSAVELKLGGAYGGLKRAVVYYNGGLWLGCWTSFERNIKTAEADNRLFFVAWPRKLVVYGGDHGRAVQRVIRPSGPTIVRHLTSRGQGFVRMANGAHHRFDSLLKQENKSIHKAAQVIAHTLQLAKPDAFKRNVCFLPTTDLTVSIHNHATTSPFAIYDINMMGGIMESSLTLPPNVGAYTGMLCEKCLQAVLPGAVVQREIPAGSGVGLAQRGEFECRHLEGKMYALVKIEPPTAAPEEEEPQMEAALIPAPIVSELQSLELGTPTQVPVVISS
eukprot:GHVN01042086.1.p1 GENE.GHVN01042086.1~~GHVN01042086.1.p1  ORF type:complete len:765 (-),score=89.39 GHVN01042086.1:1399-3693(-)